MRIVILLDRPFSRREREMLSRIEIGLADEGVRVIHAVPFNSLSEESLALYSTLVGYHDRGLAITRRHRAALLRHSIDRALDDDRADIDVVHVFGVPAWRMGMDLAGMLGACLLLELWQGGAVASAAAFASLKVGKRSPEFAVCEPAMRRALRKRSAHATAHLVPWGVHAPAHVAPLRDRAERPLSIAVLADTGDPAAVSAALAGIARLGERVGGVLVFAGTQDGATGRDSTIWSAARRLNLLDRLSLVADMEARREPILQMDMLVLPEATGRQRTIVLDAMAHGVTIVAAADELNEALIDDRTAKLVRTQTADAWAEALRDAATNIEATQHRRETAHEFVRTQKTASAHVSSVMTAYNAMIAAAKTGVPDLARQLS